MAASITFTPGSLGSINEGDSPFFSGTASLNSVWEVIVAKYPTAGRERTYFSFNAFPDSSSVASNSDFSSTTNFTIYTNGSVFGTVSTGDDTTDEPNEAFSLQSEFFRLRVQNASGVDIALLNPTQVTALYAPSGGLTLNIGKITGTIIDNDPPPNQPPTAVNFVNPTTSIAENSDTTNRIKVADITITDDGQGTNNLSVSGTDAASFEIVGTALYLKAGTILDFETKPSYGVTVNVNDPAVGGNPDATRNFTLTVTNVNDAPTAVNFSNITTALAENSDTTNRIKVADISITDDALGTNNLSLLGTDAASFEIIGTTLYLKANTTLDFETKPSYNVTVAVDDPTVGTTPDATKDFTLNVNNINEAPTAVNFDNAVTLLSENVDTNGRIKLADIIVADDGLGTNNLSLSGTDAASFEIIDTRLFLRAGTLLDFETKPTYNVTVNVDDPTLGSNPDASNTFTLNLEDAVDASPFLVINTNSSGVGSLRWAIDNANRTAGSQTIEFDPSLIGQTIDLSGELLQITDGVNIDADIDNNSTADITIDAGLNSSILSISANQTVTIEGMVLQNGLVRVSSGTGADVGGIYNRGNLTLLNTTVSSNIGLSAGGIYNDGANSILTLVGSTVSSHTSTDRGGGIYNNGGQVTITNSLIENNFGNLGGGLYNNGGTVIVNNSTFARNNSNVGGGLMNDNGTVTFNNSTLSNNQATDTVSGAINNKGTVLGAIVTLNASTVSGGVYGNTLNSGLLVITGTNSGETIQGSRGVDQISGSGGNDLLQGYQGNDTLIGGDGNDVVNGGDNNDLLQGGAGNDRLGGLGGTDRMEGGTGNDTYTVNNAAATLIEAAGEGTDTVRSQISWSLGSNFENLVLLGTGNLNGVGNSSINSLTGNSGDNALDGQSGNDQLIGNDGDDVLIGGAGTDTVTGGNGNDRFVFNAVDEGGDRITDFVTGNDKIQISAGGFGAGLSVGILAESQFAIGTMTTTDQRFLYDTSTGSLFFDSNGSAADGRTRIATLTTKPSISANDIVIVV